MKSEHVGLHKWMSCFPEHSLTGTDYVNEGKRSQLKGIIRLDN